MWRIIVDSDEYGKEEFEFETEKEAREEFEQWVKKLSGSRDGIARELWLIADYVWFDGMPEDE